MTVTEPATRRQWWQRPRLRLDQEERRVSWLELFYDLVFVVVVSELSHGLSSHPTREGVLGFVLLFVPAWWAWIGGTFYNERFETEDLSSRVIVFLQMLPVAAMAVFAHGGLGKTSAAFALSYAAARLIVTFLWVRGGWFEPIMRPITSRYALGFSFSILLFVASALVSPPWRFSLWAVALASDLLTPISTLAFQAKLPLPRGTSSKLPERFGLFVIIVLGEAVVGVVSGVAAQENLTVSAGLTGALGMALAFGLWWVYFDFVGRRLPRPGVWTLLAWNYLHLPLVVGLTAVGAGVLRALSTPGESARWLLAGAVAAALAALGLLELTLRRDADEPTHPTFSPALKLAAALAALGLGWFGRDLGSSAVLLVLIALVGAQMTYGALVWFRQPAASTAEG